MTAVSNCRLALARIADRDEELGAFLTVDGEGALSMASQADREGGPIAGLTVAVKDNLVTRGVETTCGSRILAGYVPPYDAEVVRRLRVARATILGKTNMDEFGMGSSTEHSGYFPTRNPWDLSRSPGGSSGGSAAAVAAGFCEVSLGSDTGGSVRQPAALTGIVGLKPTYGRVSRSGLVAFASSLDQVGILARNGRNIAKVLSQIAGRDPADSTSVSRDVPDYEARSEPGANNPLAGIRLGVVAHGEVDAAVETGVAAGLERLRSLGASVVPVELPHAHLAMAAYYLIAPAEASSNLARFDGLRYGVRKTGTDLEETVTRSRREGFGDEVKRRILLGTFALSSGYYDAYYERAQKARRVIADDFEAAFASCDVVVTPTFPTVAFTLGEDTAPVDAYRADRFTLPPSLAGLPAISIPAPSAGPLPVGLQLTARAFDEATLLRLARAFLDDADCRLPEAYR
ncbi:MAG: Asp-tRNA(Asn)/Glu-tRNA(Gln) amidotransferase subunit GatA [Myxococcota bacterium]